MRVSVYAFVLLMLSIIPTWAQQGAVDVASIPHIPTAMRARVPRGARSWIYGSAPIGPNRSLVFLHIYDAKKQAYNSWQSCVLILDVWKRIKTKHKPQFALLNSVHFQALSMDYPVAVYPVTPLVRIRILWLIPARQQKPVILLQCRDLGAGFGAMNEDSLIVFDNGLSNKPKTQVFKNENTLNEGVIMLYDRVDKSGYLKVISRYVGSGDVGHPADTELQWNGQQFVAVATPTPAPTATPTPTSN